jgi:CRP-like cAMP-binding protein
LIENGLIEISMTVNGQELQVNKIGKNELFGEVALIDHQPRTATAKALEKTVLIAIQRTLVNELLEKTDPIVRHLLSVILERYRTKQGHIQQPFTTPRFTELSKERNSLRGEATHQLTLANDISRALRKDEFETDGVRRKLLELGCNYEQGWLFGRPVSLTSLNI